MAGSATFAKDNSATACIYDVTASRTRRQDRPVPHWSSVSLKDRLACITRFRRSVAAQPKPFIDRLCELPWRTLASESLAAEVLPLLDAARFLERRATRLLKPRKLGRRGRPLWLTGVHAEVRRDPLGTVLIIAPSNYPLMLPGIQILQALVAGNHVMVKPSPASSACTMVLWEMFNQLVDAGVPKEAIEILGSDVAVVGETLRSHRVDKVVLTGSLDSGRAVMRELVGDQQAATNHPTPAVMELSGCDAMFVLDGADQQRVVRALRFGLTFNQSATCIAPRRIFVDQKVDATLRPKIEAMVQALPPMRIKPETAKRMAELKQQSLTRGASIVTGSCDDDQSAVAPMLILDQMQNSPIFDGLDIFDPVIAYRTFKTMDQALQIHQQCRYQLGCSIFGPVGPARELAKQLQAGTVTLNDVIAPTADPRIPFGGRGYSGFGSTRGEEGLLGMTQPRVILERRGGVMGHLDQLDEDERFAYQSVLHLIRVSHGQTWSERLRSILSLIDLDRQKKKKPKPMIHIEPEGSTGTPS